jgi:preprotein translocase subunit SecG
VSGLVVVVVVVVVVCLYVTGSMNGLGEEMKGGEVTDHSRSRVFLDSFFQDITTESRGK